MSNEFMSKVTSLQAELKAPKNQYNSFGKYKYRSCEDILEAVKPLCVKHGLTLNVSDDMLNVGERYYIKATATLYDANGNSISSTGLARESENKKGMDDSQITGTASSYARKYALGGLLCLDDTKDADTDENYRQSPRSNTKQAIKFKCTECGAEVKAVTKGDGTVVDAKTVYESCGNRCLSCYNKQKGTK